MRWFVLVAATVVALEQAAKALVSVRLPLGTSVPISGDAVRLTHIENPGVAFGLLSAWPTVPLLATALIVPALVAYVVLRRPLPRVQQAALGSIAGGALGNLLDRLVSGRVTDFVDVGVGGYRWPAFNGADVAIVLGIAGLLFLSTRRDSPDRRSLAPETVTTSAVSTGGPLPRDRSDE